MWIVDIVHRSWSVVPVFTELFAHPAQGLPTRVASQTLAYGLTKRTLPGVDGGPKGTAAVQPTPSHAMTVPVTLGVVNDAGRGNLKPVAPVLSGAAATPPVAVNQLGSTAV